MQQTGVTLRLKPGSDGDILIAVGGSGEETASAEDVDIEWDNGMLRINLGDENRQVPLQCVTNGEFVVENPRRP